MRRYINRGGMPVARKGDGTLTEDHVYQIAGTSDCVIRVDSKVTGHRYWLAGMLDTADNGVEFAWAFTGTPGDVQRTRDGAVQRLNR